MLFILDLKFCNIFTIYLPLEQSFLSTLVYHLENNIFLFYWKLIQRFSWYWKVEFQCKEEVKTSKDFSHSCFNKRMVRKLVKSTHWHTDTVLLWSNPRVSTLQLKVENEFVIQEVDHQNKNLGIKQQQSGCHFLFYLYTS